MPRGGGMGGSGRGMGGSGGGMGRGKGGGGGGRMGGPAAAGPGGECVCSACGHHEPHVRGVPCASRKCPKCNAPMTRA
jgi:hypothetical protein